MIKATNCYSNDQAISMARKIQKLQGYGVPFEIRIVKGIGDENVVSLTWDETEYERKLNEDEEF